MLAEKATAAGDGAPPRAVPGADEREVDTEERARPQRLADLTDVGGARRDVPALGLDRRPPLRGHRVRPGAVCRGAAGGEEHDEPGGHDPPSHHEAHGRSLRKRLHGPGSFVGGSTTRAIRPASRTILNARRTSPAGETA